MTSGRVEVITSVERRRRWSAAEKGRLVAATLEPGASVSGIARSAGIHPSQLYGWRRQLRAEAPAGFAPVRISVDPGPGRSPVPGVVEIEFAGGARMRIAGTVDAATLKAAIAALSGGERR